MAWAPNTLTVIKGEPASLPVVLLDKNGDLLNANGATEIWLKMKKADGTWLSVMAVRGFTWGIGPSAGYIYIFDLLDTDIDSLPVTKDQDVVVMINYGGVHQYAYCKKYLTVITL